MLTAHANTTSTDFIAQLRTFVMAFGCNQMTVDCVDNLRGTDELENEHAKHIQEAEDEAADNARSAAKQQILDAVTAWLENQPNYDIIAAPCEALIKIIEGVEV